MARWLAASFAAALYDGILLFAYHHQLRQRGMFPDSRGAWGLLLFPLLIVGLGAIAALILRLDRMSLRNRLIGSALLAIPAGAAHMFGLYGWFAGGYDLARDTLRMLSELPLFALMMALLVFAGVSLFRARLRLKRREQGQKPVAPPARFFSHAAIAVVCVVLCELAYAGVPSFCAERSAALHAQSRPVEAARYAAIAATLQPTQANKLNYALELHCVGTARATAKARGLIRRLDWSGSSSLPALAYNLKARGEAEIGNLEDAVRTAQAGLAIYPRDPQLWQMLGYVRCLQRSWPEAVEALDTAIRLFRSGSFPPGALRDAEQQRLVAIRAGRGAPEGNAPRPSGRSPAPPSP